MTFFEFILIICNFIIGFSGFRVIRINKEVLATNTKVLDLNKKLFEKLDVK